MAPTILVVDDDPVLHHVLEQYLGREGYSMSSAKDGREALELAARDLPQLIIMDVRMAGMDGLSVLRRLKESEKTKAIPVIMVTVNADRLTQLEAEVLGAGAFLTKPFRPTQLLAEVCRLLSADPAKPS